MMLVWPAQREDTSTMGPGSRYLLTCLTGKSRFSGCFGIGVLSQAALCSDILGRFDVVRGGHSGHKRCTELPNRLKGARVRAVVLIERRWLATPAGGDQARN